MSAGYYDRQGRPIDLMAWAGKLEDRSYATVARHWVRGWMVSTVWLGLDHGHGAGPPVIFETVVFPPGDEADGEHVMSERYADRYCTEAAAQAGHDQALAWVCEKLGDDAAADIAGPLMAGTPDEKWDGGLRGEI